MNEPKTGVVNVSDVLDTMAYVSSDGKHITTWTGDVLMTVTSENTGVKHRDPRWYDSLSQRLWYYRATDANGNRWYGKGSGRGMSIRMHRAR
jgi:hypothetical protein